MDVKSAFLNGVISEEVFVKQPLGFEDLKYPDHFYKLKKSLLLEQRVFHNIRLLSFDDNKVLKIINWIC